jgi:rhomboid protease GluP
VAVLVVTSVISVLGFLYPGILEALRRDPEALASGELWRILSPLLIHDGGWPHLVLNSAALIVVGTAVERLLGSGRWLALYLAGGLTGETAGYAWQPDGAGNSVAIFGLAGWSRCSSRDAVYACRRSRPSSSCTG